MNKKELLKIKADEAYWAYSKAYDVDTPVDTLKELFKDSLRAKKSYEEFLITTPETTDSLEIELDILVGTAKDIEESLEEFRKSLKRLERNIEKSNFLKSS